MLPSSQTSCPDVEHAAIKSGLDHSVYSSCSGFNADVPIHDISSVDANIHKVSRKSSALAPASLHQRWGEEMVGEAEGDQQHNDVGRREGTWKVVAKY